MSNTSLPHPHGPTHAYQNNSVVSAGLEQSGGSQQWAAAHEGVTLSANAEAVLLQSSEVAEHAEDRSKAVLRLLDFDSVGSTTSRMVVVGSSQQYVVQVALTALDPDGGLGDCVVRNVQSAATHHRMLLAYAQQTRRGEEGEGEDEETGIKVIKSEAQEEDGGAAVDPAVKPVRIKRNVKPIVYPPSNATALRYPIWWFAPFWSGSGYSSEAINYILSIYRNDLLRPEVSRPAPRVGRRALRSPLSIAHCVADPWELPIAHRSA